METRFKPFSENRIKRKSETHYSLKEMETIITAVSMLSLVV